MAEARPEGSASKIEEATTDTITELIVPTSMEESSTSLNTKTIQNPATKLTFHQTEVANDQIEWSSSFTRGIFGLDTACHTINQNKGKSVAPETLKEKPENTHAMSTRSKSSLFKRRHSLHKLGSEISKKSGSIKSVRSLKSNLTGSSSGSMAALSDHQIANLYQTKKSYQQKKTDMEMNQTMKQLDHELQLREENLLKEEMESIRQENERRQEKEEEEKLRREQFERRIQAMKETLQNERKSVEQRKQMNLQEIQYRSEREQLELDADFSETLAIRGITPKNIVTQMDIPQISQTDHSHVIPTTAQHTTIADRSTSSNGLPVPEYGKTTFPPTGFDICNPLRNENSVGVTGGMREPCRLTEQSVVGDMFNNSSKPEHTDRLFQENKTHPIDPSNRGTVGHVSQGKQSNNFQPDIPNYPLAYMGTLSALPPCEPPVFCGDPCQFQNFIDIFETVICSKVRDPKQKFVYLLQYTKGVPHELVRGCHISKSQDCFQDAVNLLREQYGQKIHIGQACVNSVTSGFQVKLSDREGLNKFSAELMACANTLAVINYSLSITDIDRIASRMPTQWKAGWLGKLDDILHEQKIEVTVGHLGEYVRKRTREVTNVPNPDTVNKSIKPLKSTFAVTVQNKPNVSQSDEPSLGCLKCNNQHYLNQCRLFRAMSYDERYDFVMKQKLCLACLTPGHWAKNCARESPCRYKGCTRMHTTLLHPLKDNNSGKTQTLPQTSVKIDNSNKSENKFSAFVNAPDDVKILFHVAPVRVRVAGAANYVITNAFFDNGSNCSFISESLKRKLGLRGPDVDLAIKTLNNKLETKSTSVFKNLELSDYFSSEYVPVSPLFCNRRIDVDESDIPSQKDVDQFAEFKNITIPRVNAEVGLLIGNDNVRLHKPIDVVYGPSDYFMIRTIAGWMVNCPPKHKSVKSSSFFVKSIPTHPLCTMCTDTLDAIELEKDALSPREQQFIDKVTNSIELENDGHYKIKLPLKTDDFKFPNNRDQAVQRIESLKTRVVQDDTFKGEYCEFVVDTLSNVYVEKADKYPIHPLREAFDCSAKFNGIPINDVLLQGPDPAFETQIINAVHDDFSVSKSNALNATSHAKNVEEIVGRGGFKSVKCVSNNLDVLASIPEQNRVNDIKILDLAVDDLPWRTHGLTWSHEMGLRCCLFIMNVVRMIDQLRNWYSYRRMKMNETTFTAFDTTDN